MSLREYFESDLDYFAWKLETSNESGKYFEYNNNIYILKRMLVEHHRTYVRNESAFNKWCEKYFSEEELRPSSTIRSTDKLIDKCPELSRKEAGYLDFILSFGAYQKDILSNVSYLNRFYICCNDKEIMVDFLPSGDYNKFHKDLIDWIQFAINYLNK